MTSKTTIRFTEADRNALSEQADAGGVTLSSFIRKAALGRRIASKTDLRVLAELRRLGGLLKHIHNETRGAYSTLTSDCLREIAAYTRGLNAELNGRRGDGTSQ
jgi:hypothetical protein